MTSSRARRAILRVRRAGKTGVLPGRGSSRPSARSHLFRHDIDLFRGRRRRRGGPAGLARGENSRPGHCGQRRESRTRRRGEPGRQAGRVPVLRQVQGRPRRPAAGRDRPGRHPGGHPGPGLVWPGNTADSACAATAPRPPPAPGRPTPSLANGPAACRGAPRRQQARCAAGRSVLDIISPAPARRPQGPPAPRPATPEARHSRGSPLPRPATPSARRPQGPPAPVPATPEPRTALTSSDPLTYSSNTVISDDEAARMNCRSPMKGSRDDAG
jgi:hypothetical protein